MKKILAAILLVAAMAFPALAGEIIAPSGYSVTQIPIQGYWANGFDVTSNGRTFVYDSNLYEVGGSENVYNTPTDYYGSFTKFDSTSGRLYFGENYFGVNTPEGSIKYVDLADPTHTAQKVADLTGNYDFAFRGTNQAVTVVGSDIYSLNLISGESKKIATTEGASGAIDVDAEGNVYYGTAAAYAYSGQSIVKWSAAQIDAAINGSDVLTVINGTKLVNNVASISGLAVDATGIYYTVNMLDARTTLAKVMRYNSNSAGGTVSEFAVAPSSWDWYSQVRVDQSTGSVFVNAGSSILKLTPTPEPGSLMALALGIGVVFARRKR